MSSQGYQGYSDKAVLVGVCTKSPDSRIFCWYEPPWRFLYSFTNKHVAFLLLLSLCLKLNAKPLFSIGLIILSTLCTCACTITQYILHSNTYEQTEISSKGVSSFTRRKITKSFQSIYSISAGNEDWQAWRQLLPSSHCWKNKNSEVWAGKVGRHSQREPDSVEPAALKGPCSVQIHQLNRKLLLSCRVEQTWLQKCKKWKN